MAELTLYGSADVTRSWWVAWMCRELGIEYQNPHSEGFLDPFWKTPEYLAINPSGLMPSIRDGEFVLWESMAINLYLAVEFLVYNPDGSAISGGSCEQHEPRAR